MTERKSTQALREIEQIMKESCVNKNVISAVRNVIECNYWESLLDEGELGEVKFANIYNEIFGHGTDGHNRLCLIAKLSDTLDSYDAMIRTLSDELDRAKLAHTGEDGE